jgi:cysteine-rich repeat protein
MVFKMRTTTLILAGLTAGLLYAAPGMAASFVVNNTGDGGDEDLGDGVCEVTNGVGDCTLRAAIEQANNDATQDTITFDGTTFPAGGETVISTAATLGITRPVTVSGPGADTVIVDNTSGDNVFEIGEAAASPAGTSFEISGLTARDGDRGVRANEFTADVILDSLVIEGNSGTSIGGGVWNDNDAGSAATLRIQNCVIANNSVSDEGAGVMTEGGAGGGGNTEITNTLIIGNSANGGGTERGGGVAVMFESTTTITGSEISGNDADNEGGGIYVDAGSTLNVEDSVIAENSTVSGDGGGIMVFNDNVALTTTATITGTSILANSAGDDGGGIAADGDATNDLTKTVLDVTSSTIALNDAAGDAGGGIIVREADATITGTTIDNNNASGDGGGIMNEGRGSLIVNNSTISRNTANEGGGIKNQESASSVTVTNSTISGNRATGDAGGINNNDDTDNTIALVNVTVAGNIADSDFSGSGEGGGFEQELNAGSFTITNSIVAGNSSIAGSPDCDTAGTDVTSGGNNLIGNDQGCTDETFDASLNDQVNVPALLGPLTPANGGDPASGGVTGVHEPQAGSTAIDGVDATIAAAPADDQRGVLRPIDGDASGTAEPDIGAVEAGCGDGVINLGEVCDDGGESAACNANCTATACGDTVVNATAGETCDDGNVDAGDGCSDACKTEACGNGVLDSGEQCEDGNADSNDGCSSTCQTESSDATTDTDGDGIPNATDDDDDGDGVLDADDNCPLDANADQVDTDGDGEGDVCDGDDAGGGGGCSLIR